VLAAEFAELRGRDIELVRDPRIGAPLADPGPDLVQLRAQRFSCHGAARDTTRRVFFRLRCKGGADKPSKPRGTGGSRMLVLTRKSNQSIMIGDEIEVSVLAVNGDKVRIGIEAPRSVPIFRKEVYLSIKAEDSGEQVRAVVDKALEELSQQE
jgi:carbon storage regulator